MRTKFIALTIATVATLTVLSLAPAPVSLMTPAAAFDRTQGGVIPGSADDYHFVQGKHGGWRPNQHRRANVGRHGGQRHGNVGRQHRGSSGHSRGVAIQSYEWHNRRFVTERIGTGYVNRRTGERRSSPPQQQRSFGNSMMVPVQ